MKGIGEYISRDAALRDWPLCDEPGDAYQFIRNFPAADVRPVRRGKWMPIIEGNEYGETYQTGCYCSECNEVLQHEPNFCPNCGADMRPEEGER